MTIFYEFIIFAYDRKLGQKRENFGDEKGIICRHAETQ